MKIKLQKKNICRCHTGASFLNPIKQMLVFYLQIEKDPFPRRPLSERSNLYLEKKGETETSFLKSSAKHSSPIMLLLANITDGDTNE